MDEGESLTWHFHEGRGLQTRKSLSGPFGGHGFAQIIPSWEFLEFMSEYLGLLFCCPLTPVCREGSTELAVKKNYPCKKITAVNHCTPRFDPGGECV